MAKSVRHGDGAQEEETFFSNTNTSSQGSHIILSGSIGPPEEDENTGLIGAGTRQYGTLSPDSQRRPASQPNLNYRPPAAHAPPPRVQPPPAAHVQPPPVAHAPPPPAEVPPNREQRHDFNYNCFPACCFTHWKHNRNCFGILIAAFSLLALVTIAFIAYYGVEGKVMRGRQEIFLVPDATYSLNNGYQSAVLHKICMKEESDISIIKWSLKKGSCNARKNFETKTETVKGILTRSETLEQRTTGRLYYLLSGSKISVHREDGRGKFYIYYAEGSEVNKLEKRCKQRQEPQKGYTCLLNKRKRRCNITVKHSKFYYLCIFRLESILKYTMNIYKHQYNTSSCDECKLENEDGTSKCCTFSSNIFHKLHTPECVFISDTTKGTSNTDIHNTTLIIDTNDDMIIWLSGLLVLTILAILVVMVTCGVMVYRKKYQDGKNFHFRINLFPDRPNYMPMR